MFRGAELIIVLVIVLIIAFAAGLFAISKLISAAQMKGHYTAGDTAPLWFLGLFASPIVLGLYTASLPDRSVAAAAAPTPEESLRSDLPAI